MPLGAEKLMAAAAAVAVAVVVDAGVDGLSFATDGAGVGVIPTGDEAAGVEFPPPQATATAPTTRAAPASDEGRQRVRGFR